MTLSGGQFDVDSLARHVPRLRRLAAHLVAGDPARADDLVQDAMLAALEALPRNRGTLYPWLRGVVRNLARMSWRSERRRREHESTAPSRGSSCDPPTCAERNELIVLMLEEFRGLKEPFRTALSLRYFEGLEPVAIARRLGMPAATVRTHLRRGLDELRTRLEARIEGRRGWMRALALFFFSATSRRSRPAAMHGLIVVGVGALLAAAVVTLATWSPASRPGEPRGEDADVASVDPPSAARRADVSREEPATADETAAADRTPLVENGAAAAGLALGAEPTWELRGALLGLQPDVPWSSPLSLRSEYDDSNESQHLPPVEERELSIEVEPDGTYLVDLASLAVRRAGIRRMILEGDDPSYLPVQRVILVEDQRGRVPDPPARFQADLCVSRASIAVGRVVDERGHPIENAIVTAYPRDEDSWPGPICSQARSATDGRFRLRAPGGEWFVLEATLRPPTGWQETGESGRRMIPARQERLLRLGEEAVLADFVLGDGASISGRVVDAAGVPAVGALVGAARTSLAESPILGRSDANGRFFIGGLGPGSYSVLALAGKGRSFHPLLTQRRERAVDVEASAGGVELTLVETVLHLTVSTDDDQRLAGASVTLWGPVAADLVSGRDPGRVPWMGTTDGSGELQVAVAPGVDYRCRIRAEGLDPSTHRVWVPDDVGWHEQVLRLGARATGATLVLRLRDDGGGGVGRAWVVLTPRAAGHSPLTRHAHSRDGGLELHDVPPGPYTMLVRPGADEWGHFGFFLDETAEVEVPEGGTVELELRIRPGGRLNARALGEAGVGLYASCRLLDAVGSEIACEWVLHNASSPAQTYAGRLWQQGFASPDACLPEGAYSLEVSREGYEDRTVPFEIQPWETRTLRVALCRR